MTLVKNLLLTWDIGKALGNDLNLFNEIYGKNDNECLEKSDLHENLKEEDNEATLLIKG